jgi:hypothetical protein
VRELHRRPLRAREVAVAPCLQREKDGVEVEPLLRQPVLHPAPGPLLPVGLFAKDACLDQAPEPIGEDRARDRGADGEVVEAPDPLEDLTEHDKRPAVADDVEGTPDGAVVGRPVEGCWRAHLGRIP